MRIGTGRQPRHRGALLRPAHVRQPVSLLALLVAGAGCLLATAGLHLDLYVTGYRTIPAIGPLFLLQVIVGIGLGLLVLATGSRLAASVSAVFALATLGGYLISLQFGLFGFREVRTTAGIVAGVLEIVTFAALGAYAATAAGWPGLLRPNITWVGLGVAGISVTAAGLLGGALAGGGGVAGVVATGHRVVLKTGRVGNATVLTNPAGRTVYWFARDTPGRSSCYGACAQYWPPVPGPASKVPPLFTGKFGVIRRADGTLQETYDGHPLYTYIGDSGPGQAHGNGLNLNGGVWHEVVVSGS